MAMDFFTNHRNAGNRNKVTFNGDVFVWGATAVNNDAVLAVLYLSTLS